MRPIQSTISGLATFHHVESMMVDAALMTSIPRVEELSFDNVVRQREVQILRTAYRMLGNWSDAEDVAQEVFVRLHKHGLGFPTEAGLYAWLYRVTVNLCVDRLRSAKHWEELPEMPGGGESAELSAIREERKEALIHVNDDWKKLEHASINPEMYTLRRVLKVQP